MRSLKVLSILALFCAVPASAGAYGYVSGWAIAKKITYGPRGAIKEILLIVDTQDGGYWAVRCQRPNLKLCDPVNPTPQAPVLIRADGKFLPSEGRVGCFWLAADAKARDAMAALRGLAADSLIH